MELGAGLPRGSFVSACFLLTVLAVLWILGRWRSGEWGVHTSTEKHKAILINQAPVAIAMFDRDMRYIAASQRWITDYSLGGASLIGRSHYEVFPEIPDRWKAVHQRCLAGAVESCEEEFFLRTSGERQILRWGVHPWRYGGHGQHIGGIIIFSEDVTARRAVEASARDLAAKSDLEKALRVQTEEINRSKDQFIATLSHELRTPLNSMLGWVEVASRSGNNPEKISQAMQAIGRAARVQAQLISDILDINRISSGKLRLDISQVWLDDLLSRAIEAALPQAQAKQITLERARSDDGLTVKGDPGRLEQCLSNLISNAIKFSPAGSRVEVSTRETGDAAEISVRDFGQGIDPRFLATIFERHRQADFSSTRVHGGLGLGLDIVKQLVELHGGRVWAKSAGLGQGSEFTISLPLSSEAQARPAIDDPSDCSLAAADLTGLVIIVVDDDLEACELLRGLLADHGAAVFTAGSAAAGMALVRKHQADLIISDIGMPHRDGCDFMRDVRAIPSDVPSIALTSFAAQHDADRCLLAGFNLHVAKPAAPAAILGAMVRLTRQKTPVPAGC